MFLSEEHLAKGKRKPESAEDMIIRDGKLSPSIRDFLTIVVRTVMGLEIVLKEHFSAFWLKLEPLGDERVGVTLTKADGTLIAVLPMYGSISGTNRIRLSLENGHWKVEVH